MSAVDCVYYYYDFHRGRENESCRLLEASPHPGPSWQRALCTHCPVPGLLEHTNCRHLVLEGKVGRHFFRRQVQVTFALCGDSLEELARPDRCPACMQSRSGTAQEPEEGPN